MFRTPVFKTVCVVFFALSFSLLIQIKESFADSTKNIPYIRVSVGSTYVPDVNITRYIPQLQLEAPGVARFRNGKNYNGAFGVVFGSTNIATEIEIGVSNFPLKSIDLGGFNFPADGTIREVSAVLNVMYKVPLGYNFRLVPYVGAGVGGQITNTFKPKLDGKELDDEAKGSLIYQLFAGAEYELVKNLYIYSQYTMKRTPELLFNEFEVDERRSHTLSAGIRCSF